MRTKAKLLIVAIFTEIAYVRKRPIFILRNKEYTSTNIDKYQAANDIPSLTNLFENQPLMSRAISSPMFAPCKAPEISL